MRQKRHRVAHLAWRGVIAGLSDVLMLSGVYPMIPHAAMMVSRWRKHHPHPVGQVRAAFAEWGLAVGLSAARPLGFFGLPGEKAHGPRPIVVLHGYAMNRANFLLLACRLRAAGLGPVFGFEYWTLGRTASAAKKLAAYVDEVRAATGASSVDVIGHSMGGMVGRYYVQLGGGDGAVTHLVTLGSPHEGTEMSAIGIGRPARELLLGSTLLERLRTAPTPTSTKMTVIWSRSDALVPGGRQGQLHGAEELVFDDLGHLGLLASRRVADAVIARLRT